jgi:predicted amidophosphoribosyltransferase
MVFFGPYHKGNYVLLAEPYCRICAHTDVDTECCVDHQDLDGFERIYAMGKYVRVPQLGGDDLLTHHIRTLKKYLSHASPLGKGLEIVARELNPELLDSTMIVPIPQHPDKLAERGFNQSLELSKVVGDGLNLPVKDVLVKTENIDLRSLTGKEARRLAVEDMYTQGEDCSEMVGGEKILIIDDVVTTGFTASKCARLLKEAGAESINVLVAGRTG